MARREAPPRKRSARFIKRLVIMAKSPALGRVKRRLGHEIGDVAALRFYRSCLLHILLRLARDPRWQTLIAVTPDREAAAYLLPLRGKTKRLPQGNGDLGHRMQRLFKHLPPGPVIIVGGDVPSINPGLVEKSFKQLGGADAVFGRATDGGYWLIGLKRMPRVLRPFNSVRWSGPHAFADTIANLKGKRIVFAATLSDVDTEVDLQRERVNAERLIQSDNMPRQ
jgi:hypothetical protein